MTRDELRKMMEERPLPEWLRQMHEHYRRTGGYRLSDIRRVLGDIRRSVDAGPQASLAKHFLSR